MEQSLCMTEGTKKEHSLWRNFRCQLCMSGHVDYSNQGNDTIWGRIVYVCESSKALILPVLSCHLYNQM
jgi:hypothetical protein